MAVHRLYLQGLQLHFDPNTDAWSNSNARPKPDPNGYSDTDTQPDP